MSPIFPSSDLINSLVNTNIPVNLTIATNQAPITPRTALRLADQICSFNLDDRIVTRHK